MTINHNCQEKQELKNTWITNRMRRKNKNLDDKKTQHLEEMKDKIRILLDKNNNWMQIKRKLNWSYKTIRKYEDLVFSE